MGRKAHLVISLTFSTMPILFGGLDGGGDEFVCLATGFGRGGIYFITFYVFSS